MGTLDTQTNFRSLSVKDLLEARDLYHWQLINRDNVIGTAVGLYLIRNAERVESRAAGGRTRASPGSEPRTFENSSVRDDSWPCVLVIVKEWLPREAFAHHPEDFVPPTLYMPDGRRVPVCVVQARPAAPADPAPADIRWPDSYLGGGFPVVANVQGEEHRASIGCIVSDGHKLYAMTNRHVCGDAGAPLYARLRGEDVEIGKASDLQLTRLPFQVVYPEFPGHRTYSTLDVGLIDVTNANDWRSAVYGLRGRYGMVADFNELNLGLQLIDQPVEAFGAASGLLHGTIKALFYRHKTVAGYDFVSDFLIAPDGNSATRRGDSGTVWHLQLDAGDGSGPILRPMAIEWGGQSLSGTGTGPLNFALATSLSGVCRLLNVDLVREDDDGAVPFWGQTGHYSIATAAIAAVRNGKLNTLLDLNRERISFAPNELTPEQIKAKLGSGEFVELADVPDLVWKKTSESPGGRDYARNAGPEHPNHYADIDQPNEQGQTLRALCLADPANLDPQFWMSFYQSVGSTDPRHEGLLPFRVWQLFDEMIAALKGGRLDRFVCAAGIISHYVGDACQPLHGSYLSDGYHSDPQAKTWPGKGVHSTYEDKMIDRHSPDLLDAMSRQASAALPARDAPPPIRSGKDAALATLKLMDLVARILPPTTLCDRYIALGGGTSRAVVDGLWASFGDQTAQIMACGARYLAAIWEAAHAVAAVDIDVPDAPFSESSLAAIYQDPGFAPSVTIDRIAAILEGRAAGGAGRRKKSKRRTRKP